MSYKLFGILLSVFLLLGACSTTGDDTSVDEEYYQPIHKINSTKVFVADSKNVNYADEQSKENEKDVLSEKEMTEYGGKKGIVSNKNVSIIIEDKVSDVRNKMVAMVLFENGSSVVDNKYNSELKKAAKVAKEKNAKIMVYGYASSKTRNTDSENQKNINFKMSQKRAQAVAEVLKKDGIKKENIVIKAFADTMPLLNDSMIEGERLNRRAEVYLVY